jgi:inorganic pyrophosphatase
MRIVTSGAHYIDIDAYAGCIAYAELLQLQGHEAQAVCEAPWNESISKSVRKWNSPLETTYIPSKDDRFILIDVSDPEHLENFVALDRVSEVIDHHPGFEQYWDQRIGKNAHVEFIGAACTQVYEQWKSSGFLNNISSTSAGLLVTGILDNTLSFGARVTTDRDKVAYKDLLQRAELPENWSKQYFTECQEAIFADVRNAITNDTKTLNFISLPGEMAVGQLVVWDAEMILQKYQSLINETLSGLNPKWFLNLVNVNEHKSYFISQDPLIKSWLSELLDITFIDSVAQAKRLWLRKEIIKADIDISKVKVEE